MIGSNRIDVAEVAKASLKMYFFKLFQGGTNVVFLFGVSSVMYQLLGKSYSLGFPYVLYVI